MLAETQTWLGVDWPAVGAIATVVLAFVTAVLAGATYWLGRKTREMAVETRKLAGTTTKELELLEQQTKAMQAQAAGAVDQLNELREARFAEFLPVLHWQLHAPGIGAGYIASAEQLRLVLKVLLTNVGKGPARLLSFTVNSRDAGAFSVANLVFPSTLPAGERIEVEIYQPRQPGQYPGEVRLTLDLIYADMAMLRRYETMPTIVARWTEGPSSVVSFDADDLSPDARRYYPDEGIRVADVHSAEALRRQREVGIEAPVIPHDD